MRPRNESRIFPQAQKGRGRNALSIPALMPLQEMLGTMVRLYHVVKLAVRTQQAEEPVITLWPQDIPRGKKANNTSVEGHGLRLRGQHGEQKIEK